MTVGAFAAIALPVLGLFLAITFGFQATRLLAQARKTPPLVTPKNALAADPADDLPTMRFKGEPFETRWQGSRGYERPDDLWATASRDWGGYVWVAIITRLRPSRFSDPSYWRRYLPGTFALSALFFVLIPLLIITLGQPLSGFDGTFSPSRAQRDVPVHNRAYVNDPPACGTSTTGAAAAGRIIWVSYANDANVFSVRPGDLVAVNYLYGRPVFSPGVPLCVPTTPTIADRSGVVEYQVTDSGTGYIYIPQPNGTVVAQIDVRPDYSAAVYVLLGITAAVMCFDIVVLIRLRRATHARWTRIRY